MRLKSANLDLPLMATARTRELGRGSSRRDGVTVPDEELGLGQGLDSTPRLADQ